MIETRVQPTFRATIWIGGDFDDARRAVREFAADTEFCATISRTQFIYTRGEEAGVQIGLLNYPNNPTEPHEICFLAQSLALLLMDRLYQDTALICTDENTVLLARKNDK